MITIMTKEDGKMRIFEVDTEDHVLAIQTVRESLPVRHRVPVLARFDNSNPKKEALA